MNTMKHMAIMVALAVSISTNAANAEVVVVVSSNNPLTSLSPDQIADIFLGRTNRFPDGSEAVPIDQAENSPERTEFVTRYIGQSPTQVRMHWSKLIFTGRGQPPKQVGGGTEVKELIAANPNAIGYIDQSLVDDSVTVVSRLGNT